MLRGLTPARAAAWGGQLASRFTLEILGPASKPTVSHPRHVAGAVWPINRSVSRSTGRFWRTHAGPRPFNRPNRAPIGAPVNIGRSTGHKAGRKPPVSMTLQHLGHAEITRRPPGLGAQPISRE